MVQGQTVFSRFADLSSFVIHEERLLRIATRPPENDEDFLSIGSRQFYLAPSPTLSEIEDLERRIRSDTIFEFKKEFVARTVEREFASGSEIADYQRTTQALRFVLYDVLPLMINTAAELGQLLGVEQPGTKRGEEVVREIVEKELARRERGINEMDPEEVKAILRRSLPQTEIRPIMQTEQEYAQATSVLGQVLGNMPVYVANGTVFELRPRRASDKLSFRINDNTYKAFPAASLSIVEQAYSEALDGVFSLEAIDEFDQQLDVFKDTEQNGRKGLEAFAERRELSYGNLGYIREGDTFFVYWEIPKFAMQNPLTTDVYHPFPATKVCVSINVSHGEIFQSDHAFIKDPTVHPFIEIWDRPYQRICNLSSNYHDSTAQDVVAHLSEALSAVMHGLTRKSIEAHGGGGEESGFFGTPLRKCLDKVGRMSRDEAVAAGYMITNEWTVMGENNGKEEHRRR